MVGMTTFEMCRCCGEEYPAALVTEGVCYQCHEASDAPDDDSAAELAAHIDDTRAEPWEYACDIDAYETAAECRGEL